MSNYPWLKYRRSTAFKVSFPTLPSLTVQPGEVDLYQEKFSHDILELTYVRESKVWASLLKTGVPVVFSWRQGNRAATWTGYVSHVDTQTAAQQNRTMKVTCLGASYKLKTRSGKNWKNKTIPEVAAQIAKEYGLKFAGDPSSKRFDQLSVSGQSYWSWLRELAEKIGYAFYVENTTMYMRPLTKLLTETVSNAPIMGLDLPAPDAGVAAYDRTLDSFTIKDGDYFDFAENTYANKVTAGVNPLTGKVLSSTSSPAGLLGQSRTSLKKPLFTDFSGEVVHSKAFSKQTSKDLAFGAKFVTTAKLRGQGDPRLRPYHAVYVLNTGVSTDGFWVVNKVHHSFNITGIYEVDMEIATDGIGPNTAASFRNSGGLSRGTIDVESLMVNDLAENHPKNKSSNLVVKTPLIKESNQGFNRTSGVWKGI
jgi:hypothetical protein